MLTISGNDVLFTKAVNDCIFRFDFPWNMKGCDERLAEVEGILDSPGFKKEVMDTYALIIKAGRDAGGNRKGADPPESFQAFVGKLFHDIPFCVKLLTLWMILGSYVGLFNHDDPGCNDVYWNIVHWGITYKQRLTIDLRKPINTLVEKLNGVLKSAANELEPFGVFYVEGHNDGFMGRRFCEPNEHKVHEADFQDKNAETGFWSHKSTWGKLDEGEGPPVRDGQEAATQNMTDLADQITEILVPDPSALQNLNRFTSPWDVNPKLKDYKDLATAVRELTKDNPEAQDMDDGIRRISHPKGSAYKYFDKWFEVIASKRDKPNGSTSSPSPGYQPGTCSFHLTQEDHCGDETSDYVCSIVLKDNDGNEIGSVEGESCTADDPLDATSKLPSVLSVSGQHDSPEDPVQFTYGGVIYSSDSQCSVGGWDPQMEVCPTLDSGNTRVSLCRIRRSADGFC